MQWDEEQAELEYYEKKFGLADPTHRFPRKPRNEQQRFEMHRAQVQQLAEVAGLENVWEISYTPARFEGGFLRESLQPFYEQEQIIDVMALVKGGKEANVYRCRAHPSMDVEWIAAKVYRPRQFRNLSNDAMYREGRQLLSSEDGRPQAIRPRDDRTERAVNKKTAFGVSGSPYILAYVRVFRLADSPCSRSASADALRRGRERDTDGVHRRRANSSADAP